MASIEKFLGQSVNIPEDRRYDPKQGIWGQTVDGIIRFGLSQPALVLCGGVKDIDRLVDPDQTVQRGESVLFAITGKILYLEAPVAGRIAFNPTIGDNPGVVTSDPYGRGWLFAIAPENECLEAFETLGSAEAYMERLRHSDGYKNPEGVKGGVSGICKAVYTGIGAQKIK